MWSEGCLLYTSVFRGSGYYEIITTRKGYQVLRYFMVGATYKVGQKAEYSIRAVSYTHLDVYKRQDQDISDTWIKPSTPGAISMNAP